MGRVILVGIVGAVALAAACSGSPLSPSPSSSPPSVVSIQISGLADGAVVGIPLVLQATTTLSDGSMRNDTATVTWTSSDPTVARVDTGGVLTSLRPGTTNIGATISGVGSSATASVVMNLAGEWSLKFIGQDCTQLLDSAPGCSTTSASTTVSVTLTQSGSRITGMLELLGIPVNGRVDTSGLLTLDGSLCAGDPFKALRGVRNWATQWSASESAFLGATTWFRNTPDQNGCSDTPSRTFVGTLIVSDFHRVG